MVNKTRDVFLNASLRHIVSIARPVVIYKELQHMPNMLTQAHNALRIQASKDGQRRCVAALSPSHFLTIRFDSSIKHASLSASRRNHQTSCRRCLGHPIPAISELGMSGLSRARHEHALGRAGRSPCPAIPVSPVAPRLQVQRLERLL